MFKPAFNPCAGSATLSSGSYSQSGEELPKAESHAVRPSPESPRRRNRPCVLIAHPVGVARQTKLGNQTAPAITSNHAHAGPVRRALDSVSQLLQRFGHTAGRFTLIQRWRWPLRFIFRDWIKTQNSDPVFLPLPGRGQLPDLGLTEILCEIQMETCRTGNLIRTPVGGAGIHRNRP